MKGPRFFLVTGGAGFLGSALVKRLLAVGHRVRVLDNESRGDVRRLAEVMDRIEWVQADIRDAGAVSAATKGVDAVCHLASINGTEFFYTKPELVLEVGVKGIVNVVDACLANGIGELILASSSEVYHQAPRVPTDETAPMVVPDPLNPRFSYAGNKIITELYALNFGRHHLERVVVFRPHNVYGPDMGWEHVIPQFALRMKDLCASTEGRIRFPLQGSGEETRAFVFIDDFIDGLLTVIDRGEHLNIYHIGTSEEVSIAEVATQVGACFGREIEIVPGELYEGGTARRCPDVSKLASLGYVPTYKLREGLPRTVAWYTEHSDRRPKTGDDSK